MSKLTRTINNIPIIRKYLNKIRFHNYQVGRWTYGNPEIVSWNDETQLVIGSFCSISKGVKIILGGEHRTDWVSTFPFNLFWDQAQNITGHPSSKGNVIIENDVWIGTDSIILSGVRIGNGSVIGARSVVVKDIPPYAVVAGNPAQFIRYRFSEKIINELLRIKWWEWDDKKIRLFIPELMNNDIHSFIEKARSVT